MHTNARTTASLPKLIQGRLVSNYKITLGKATSSMLFVFLSPIFGQLRHLVASQAQTWVSSKRVGHIHSAQDRRDPTNHIQSEETEA